MYRWLQSVWDIVIVSESLLYIRITYTVQVMLYRGWLNQVLLFYFLRLSQIQNKFLPFEIMLKGFSLEFQHDVSWNRPKSKMCTPKVGFFYRYCSLNVFSSENLGGEHKMKLIFSNSSGFVLVQKIKYTRKKGEKKSTLGVTAWFTSRRFTPMRPWLTRHLTRSLFGVELVEDENRKIKYAEGFFMSYSFKCHYKQLFGGMFDGSFHVEVCLQVV